MKMLIDKPGIMASEVVCISWQRDPVTLELLSMHTESGTAGLLGFPLGVFQDADAWYNRMVPADAGKELLLLKEVYTKGKGKIHYRILGNDGTEWDVTESVELTVPEGKDRRVLNGEWICEKNQ